MRRTAFLNPRRTRLLGFDPLEQRALLAVTGLDTSSVDPSGKFSFDLSSLHLEHREFIETNPNFDAVFTATSRQLLVAANSVAVYAVANGDPARLQSDMQALGVGGVSAEGVVVSGMLPIQSLDELARLPSVKFARPVYAPRTNGGLITSEADYTQNAIDARSLLGVDGTGITIGILSDSFNGLGGADIDGITGDLPPLNEIDILLDYFGPIPPPTDEGRGMAQLIYDLAPGSDLAFHTAFGGPLTFAEGIRRLAIEADASVIVDDVTYLADPWFQDGFVARAVDDVVLNHNVAYFSSAGNRADQSFEGEIEHDKNPDFNFLPYLPPGTFDSIDGAPAFRGGTQYVQTSPPFISSFPVTVPDNASLLVFMQWDQPYFSQTLPLDGTQPGSANDYDIYVFDPSGMIVGGATTNNLGGDPLEVLDFFNGPDVPGTDFIIQIYKHFEPELINVASVDVPTPIPDNNPGEAISRIVIPVSFGELPNARVVDVNVLMHISHLWDSDLTVELEHDSLDEFGNPVILSTTLFSNVDGDGDDFGTMIIPLILDDEAIDTLDGSDPPFPGFFQPQGSLSVFDGRSAFGEWRLVITDNFDRGPAPLDEGILQSWSLQIQADTTTDGLLIKTLQPGGILVPDMRGAPTITSHHNAIGAQAIGAVKYTDAPGESGNPLVTESFSSLGGVPIFFDVFGTRLDTDVVTPGPQPEIRLKPNYTSVDGTNTTFFPGPNGDPPITGDFDANHFPNFFGTSAAAPHAAAIGALLRQALPDLTPFEIYAAMQDATIDMMDPGFDFWSGYGFLMADMALKIASLNYRGSIEGTKFIDRDADGVQDPNEEGMPGFEFYIDSNQNGVRDQVTQTFATLNTPRDIIEASPANDATPTLVKALVFGVPTTHLVDIDVNLTITHDADKDLDVYLISPTGQKILLFADIGGSGDDFLGTILDSEAAVPIASGSPPYTGRFRPFESLSLLYDEDPNGLWYLEVTDDEFFNTGRIEHFSLTITYEEPIAVTDGAGKYTFENLTFGPYTVTEIPQADWQQTSFVSAANKALLVTEIDAGGTDAFEIQNTSDDVLDTTGWFVAVSDSPFGSINEVHAIIWQLPDQIAPREVLYRTDSPADSFFGGNIAWNKNNTRIGSGWVMIVDNHGQVVDWMGWGWTPEDIANFNVNVGGVQISGLEGSWTGSGVDRSGPGTLQRTGSQDTNSSADFVWFNVPSLSEQNFLAGLVVPTVSALNSPSILVTGTSLDVAGQDFGNAFLGAFPRVVATLPFDIAAPPVSSVEFAFSEAMNVGSFTVADIVSFTGPGGVNLLPAVTGIVALNGGTRFRVNFTAQSAQGTYTIVVGPNITAADDGSPMDQDADGTAGEAIDDRFTLSFDVLLGQISGVKWNDLNANGVREFGEPLLAGWTIYIDVNEDGVLDGGDLSTVTDASGAYSFGSLPAGSYTIREVLQPGFQQTFPVGGAHVVISAGGSISGVDFGNRAIPAWTAAGPSPITGGQVEGITDGLVAGAIHTVVAHPTDADILYLGAVNGGVWRTKDATTPAGPIWTPLTDEFPSLSVGALEMDPADPNRLIVGAGRYSSFAQEGDDLTGLLLTADGGETWTPIGAVRLAGRNISGVALRGSTILAAANNRFVGDSSFGGLYRSTNGGAAFNLISGLNGLPVGDVTDLVGDPTNPNRFYASVIGLSGGIFRSDDAGATWVNVTPLDSQINGLTNNIEMAVNRSVGVLYVGVVNEGELLRVFRSATQGDSWLAMALAETIEGGVPVGIQPGPKPGGQGAIHFSIVADPVDVNLVYVGGDRQPDPFPNSIGANNFTGRLFRGDAAQPLALQWTPLTHVGTAGNSAPHADSREMVFDANGDLIETDDGGIYRRTNPQSSAGDWFSLNGNLQVTEFHSVAYDSVSDIVIGGTQDVGTVEQTATGSVIWRTVNQGDGGVVAVDDHFPLQSIRYSSSQFLGGMVRRTVDAANMVITTQPVGLVEMNTMLTIDQIDVLQFYTPIALNDVDPNRMVIGSLTKIYESFNQGDLLTVLETFPEDTFITANAFVYGGRRGGSDDADILFVGARQGLFVRTTVGTPLVEVFTYPGTSVVDLVADPNTWTTMYAIDQGRVFVTTDGGTSWDDITGNLPGGQLRTIEVVASHNFNLVLVGGNDGLYGMISTAPGVWADYGGAALPNGPVSDLEYDRQADALLVGTLGRGAWLQSNFSGTIQIEVLSAAAGFTAADLGPITNQWVGNLNLAQSPQNYRVTASAAGILTVAPRFSSEAGNVKVTVYDDQMHVVATSPNGGRLDLPTTAGAIYNLSFEGTNTNLDVKLANIVQQVGSTVTIRGTAGDDVFTFTAGSPHRVSVNGANYEFDPASVSTIIFESEGGNDLAQLTGSTQADLVRLGDHSGKLFGPGYAVHVLGVGRIEAIGGGGVDSAVFDDSAGNDTLITAPGFSYMTGPGFGNSAEGFVVVRATSSSGDDVVILNDTAGDDTYFSTPAYLTYRGPGMDHEARGFATVRARATSGSDQAILHDSAGNDVVVTRPEWTALQGPGYDHEARGFDIVRVRSVGGDDVAIMLDSPGDDQFISTLEWVSMKGPGFDHEVRGFETIRGRASAGNDLAIMYDSPGDDMFVSRPEWTALQGPGFDHEARGFDVIRGRATGGGFDQAIMLDSAGDDIFVARPEAAAMTGPGFDHEARGFDSVRGIASGGRDQAVLIDSVFDDRLIVRRDSGHIESASWLAWAVQFEELTARSGNGGTNTKDVDAAITFLFNDRWS